MAVAVIHQSPRDRKPKRTETTTRKIQKMGRQRQNWLIITIFQVFSLFFLSFIEMLSSAGRIYLPKNLIKLIFHLSWTFVDRSNLYLPPVLFKWLFFSSVSVINVSVFFHFLCHVFLLIVVVLSKCQQQMDKILHWFRRWFGDAVKPVQH